MSIFIILLMASDTLYFSTAYSKLLYVQELYNNIVGMEAIRTMFANMAPVQNASGQASLIAAMKAAASMDGFSLRQSNGTILIESDTGPKVYSTIELK